MGSGTLTRILSDIDQLETEELRTIEDAISIKLRAAELGYSPEELAVMDDLVKSGLLLEIKPRARKSVVDFTPVVIKGEPLSETIIRERG